MSEATLDAACRNVVQLWKAAPGPVRRITVRSGDTTVEVEWLDAPAEPTANGMMDNEAAGGAGAPLCYITAPMVGTFYRAPEPGAKPFVSEGDVVEQGQQVGILEAMKLMNAIEADCRGRVVQFLVPTDATPVEYGQRLIALAPTHDS